MSEPAAASPVKQHELLDEPLLTLDALADAADRLPRADVEHHLGNLPVVLPGGESRRLDRPPGEIVRGVATNRCWVMLASLARLPEYEALLRRAAARFELSLRARGDVIVAHALIVFVGAPGATVPVHFDRNHHELLQIRGTKTVGTGVFSDPREQQRQVERGMRAHRLNADAVPDDADEHVLSPGQALTIPAYRFHWVSGGDDVSVSLTCAVSTETTAREAAVHRFNLGLRRAHLPARAPGRSARIDRAKEQAVRLSARVSHRG